MHIKDLINQQHTNVQFTLNMAKGQKLNFEDLKIIRVIKVQNFP